MSNRQIQHVCIVTVSLVEIDSFHMAMKKTLTIQMPSFCNHTGKGILASQNCADLKEQWRPLA